MNDCITHRKRKCDAKVRFNTRKKAKQHRKEAERHVGGRLEIYLCSQCEGYHYATDRSSFRDSTGQRRPEDYLALQLPLALYGHNDPVMYSEGSIGILVHGKRGRVWIPTKACRDVIRANDHVYLWCQTALVDQHLLHDYLQAVSKEI